MENSNDGSIDFLEVSRGVTSLSVVLGAVLEDARELDVVELPVLDGRLLEEVVDVVAAEPLSHRHQNVAEVVLGKRSCEEQKKAAILLLSLIWGRA